MHCEAIVQPINIGEVKELKTFEQVIEFVMGEEIFKKIGAAVFDFNGTLYQGSLFPFPIFGLKALGGECHMGIVTGSGPTSFEDKILKEIRHLPQICEKINEEIFSLGIFVNHGAIRLGDQSKIGVIESEGIEEELFANGIVEKLAENIKNILNDQENKWPEIEWATFYPSLKCLERDEPTPYNYVYYVKNRLRLDEVRKRYNSQVILSDKVKDFSNLLLELGSSKLVIKLKESGSLDELQKALLEGIEEEVFVRENKDRGDGKGKRLVILPLGADKLSVMQAMIDNAGLTEVPKIYFGDASNDIEALIAAEIGVIVGKKEWELTEELIKEVLLGRKEKGKEGLLLVVHPKEVDFMFRVLAAAIRLGRLKNDDENNIADKKSLV